MSGFAALLKRVAAGETLGADQAAEAFGAIMAGEVSEMRMASLLTVLALRKPTVEEIVGAVRAMRAKMTSIEANPYAIDLCGTGGDGIGTLNISTACAFVVAGLRRARRQARQSQHVVEERHGGRCLEALGVNIALSPAEASRCLREAGLCFLFAQAYHPAMKYAAPVRKELGFRTIFNLIGPLSNPARVRRQLVGVYDKEWCVPLAEVLGRLGAERAWVVNGDGLDELAISGPSHVAILDGGKVTTREFGPEKPGSPGRRSRPSRAAPRTRTRRRSGGCSTASRAPIAISCCSIRPRRWSSRARPRICEAARSSPRGAR